MKRALTLLFLVCLLAGCGEEGRAIFGSITPVPKGTPVVLATPPPTPTPKPGNWMLKDYRNPLEQKPK